MDEEQNLVAAAKRLAKKVQLKNQRVEVLEKQLTSIQTDYNIKKLECNGNAEKIIEMIENEKQSLETLLNSQAQVVLLTNKLNSTEKETAMLVEELKMNSEQEAKSLEIRANLVEQCDNLKSEIEVKDKAFQQLHAEYELKVTECSQLQAATVSNAHISTEKTKLQDELAMLLGEDLLRFM